MSSKTIINGVAVFLFLVVAGLVANTIISSGAWHNEDDRSPHELKMQAAIDEAAQETERVRAEQQRGQSAAARRTSASQPAPSQFDVEVPELVKKIEQDELAKMEQLDPERKARRDADTLAARKAIQSFCLFRALPTAEHAAAVEVAVQSLRDRPSDFRDPDKPLETFYNIFVRPFTVKPHPEHPGDYLVQRQNQPTAEDWRDFIACLKTWSKLQPKSITPLVARAKLQVCYAWEARGTGFAPSVTDESWELYRDRIEDAVAALDQAAKIGKPDAQYYVTRITVTKAHNGDRDLVLDSLEQGRKLAPDYYPLYIAAADFLLPRWHGYPGEIEAVANRLYDELGGDTGKLVFFRMASFTHQFDPYTVIEGDYELEKLNAAAKAMLTHHPLLFGNTRFAALIGWLTEDRPLVLRSAELLRGQKLRDGQGVLDYGYAESAIEGIVNHEPPTDIVSPEILRRQRAPVTMLAFFSGGLAVTPGRSWSRLLFYRPPDFERAGAKDLDGAHCEYLQTYLSGGRLFYDVRSGHDIHAVSISRERGQPPILFDAVPAKRVHWLISRDGKRVVGLEPADNLHVWNGESGAKERTLKLPVKVNDLALTVDGQQLVVQEHGGLVLIDLATGLESWRFTASADSDFGCNEFVGPRPDGTFAVAGVDRKDKTQPIGAKSWRLWKPGENPGPVLFPAPAHASRPSLSEDGRYLVWNESASQRQTVVADLERREIVARYPHADSPFAAAVSPDNAWLAVGFSDGALRLWKLPTEKE